MQIGDKDFEDLVKAFVHTGKQRVVDQCDDASRKISLFMFQEQIGLRQGISAFMLLLLKVQLSGIMRPEHIREILKSTIECSESLEKQMKEDGNDN